MAPEKERETYVYIVHGIYVCMYSSISRRGRGVRLETKFARLEVAKREPREDKYAHSLASDG